MGYRETIPPERLEEFETLGESEVRVKLDAGHYGGRHKDHAILFLKLCESEREAPTIPSTPWHEEWWGKLILVIVAAVIIAVVLSWFDLG